MNNKFSQYFNKGNDCDACMNQYHCGIDGDAVGCKRHDEGLECEFEEDEQCHALKKIANPILHMQKEAKPV